MTFLINQSKGAGEKIQREREMLLTVFEGIIRNIYIIQLSTNNYFCFRPITNEYINNDGYEPIKTVRTDVDK